MTKKLTKILGLMLAVVMTCSVITLTSYAASVPQVKSVKVTDTDEDEIELRWTKVNSATGYQVYIKNGSGSWKKALSTKKTSADIKKLKSAEEYSVKVRAYKKAASGKITYGSYSSVVVTSTEPDEVRNLSIKKTAETSAKLSWKAVTGADGYRVYKYNTSTKKWVKLSDVKTTSLNVTVSKNGSEKFKVRAYNLVNGKRCWGDASSAAICGQKVIGCEKAKSIALCDAGVKASALRDYEAKLEKKGTAYVYDIEFESGKYEYEYRINAQTGKIVGSSREVCD